MTKNLTVAKGWKFTRKDGTHFMLWQYESYRVTHGVWEGTTGSLMDVFEDTTGIFAQLSVLGGFLMVIPEILSECN